MFVYEESSNSKYFTEPQVQQQTLKTLEVLKQRGRKISLFFNQPEVKVYEIENEPHASKINDLIF